jgi:hypothetical protein
MLLASNQYTGKYFFKIQNHVRNKRTGDIRGLLSAETGQVVARCGCPHSAMAAYVWSPDDSAESNGYRIDGRTFLRVDDWRVVVVL